MSLTSTLSRGSPVRRALRAGAVVSLIATLSAAADARLAKDGEASATFHASATGGVAIEGTTGEMLVTQTDASVVVTVPLAGLRTGIALRDKHLREKYLQTDRFPNAVLSVQRSVLRFPTDGAVVSDSATGTVVIHGQTQSVRFRYAARRAGAAYLVNGAMKLKIDDFGIEKPSFLGVEVRPEVEVRVQFRVKDE